MKLEKINLFLYLPLNIFKNIRFNYNIMFKYVLEKFHKLGIGDWGLGIGPNPQSPIPNPQSPIPNPQFNIKNFISFKKI
jgi:hypothetical protein